MSSMACRSGLPSPPTGSKHNPNPNPNPASLSVCCTLCLPATAQIPLLYLLLPQRCRTHGTPPLCLLATSKHLTMTLTVTPTLFRALCPTHWQHSWGGRHRPVHDDGHTTVVTLMHPCLNPDVTKHHLCEALMQPYTSCTLAMTDYQA